MLLWVTTLATSPLCCSLNTPMPALQTTPSTDAQVPGLPVLLHQVPKACIHTHTRAKTSGFLKVLSHTHPDAEMIETKTISGKTFSSH
ncbi:unnamed protein product [Pipistrellus nathusii]|uniref:Secreted protein n=1 Tax=Pipistrellus nathusii TaxID=59473 RepID=A0ABN9ZT07_PIPNA